MNKRDEMRPYFVFVHRQRLKTADCSLVGTHEGNQTDAPHQPATHHFPAVFDHAVGRQDVGLLRRPVHVGVVLEAGD